jgi:hypothetical protein
MGRYQIGPIGMSELNQSMLYQQQRLMVPEIVLVAVVMMTVVSAVSA